MIGFNDLGKRGRMGNQMFQCAALMGIAAKRNFDCTIPDHSQCKNHSDRRHHELQTCFKMTDFSNKYGSINNAKTHGIWQFSFYKEVLDDCPDNISLDGYFQTEKYFKHIESKIRKNYTFKDPIIEKCLEYEKDIFRDKPVAVIIRRGDYLTQLDKHCLCSEVYYRQAMLHFNQDRCFWIFSDDPLWCKQQSMFQNKNIRIIDINVNDIYRSHFDLCLMSMCYDFIIANSTFGWWGAWLSNNTNKKVIAPEKWFGPELSKLDTRDIIPCNWKKI